MAPAAVQNPPAQAQSKSSKKKKAKAERTESPAPANDAPATPTQDNASDEASESPYVRELAK